MDLYKCSSTSSPSASLSKGLWVSMGVLAVLTSLKPNFFKISVTYLSWLIKIPSSFCFTCSPRKNSKADFENLKRALTDPSMSASAPGLFLACSGFGVSFVILCVPNVYLSSLKHKGDLFNISPTKNIDGGALNFETRRSNKVHDDIVQEGYGNENENENDFNSLHSYQYNANMSTRIGEQWTDADANA
ncbi:hypothetical protein Tco_0038826 [Tanacetum coccineum]